MIVILAVCEWSVLGPIRHRSELESWLIHFDIWTSYIDRLPSKPEYSLIYTNCIINRINIWSFIHNQDSHREIFIVSKAVAGEFPLFCWMYNHYTWSSSSVSMSVYPIDQTKSFQACVLKFYLFICIFS